MTSSAVSTAARARLPAVAATVAAATPPAPPAAAARPAPGPAAAAATAALGARARLVHIQRAAQQLATIQTADRRRGLGGVGHLEKAKTLRRAGDLVLDDRTGRDLPVLFERHLELILGHAVGQVTHIQVHHFLLGKWSNACAAGPAAPPAREVQDLSFGSVLGALG